mgnify:CR=1 FL=1
MAKHEQYMRAKEVGGEDGSVDGSAAFIPCVWLAGDEGNGTGENVVYLVPDERGNGVPLYGWKCAAETGTNGTTWACRA